MERWLDLAILSMCWVWNVTRYDFIIPCFRWRSRFFLSMFRIFFAISIDRWEKFRFSSRYGKNTISTNWICAWNINSRDFSLRTRRTFGSFSLTTRVCLWLDHKPLGLVNIKGKELQTVHFVVWPYCIVDFNPKLASLRQLNKHCKQLKVWKH